MYGKYSTKNGLKKLILGNKNSFTEMFEGHAFRGWNLTKKNWFWNRITFFIFGTEKSVIRTFLYTNEL